MGGPDDKDENDAAARERAALDDLYGEQIARDIYDQVGERREHYRRAHHPSLLDKVSDFLTGADSTEECNNPRCDVPEFEAEDRQDSWWERWFRGSDPGEGSSGSSD